MTSPRDEAPETAAPDEGQVSELSDLSEAQESGGADAVEKTTGVPPEHDQ